MENVNVQETIAAHTERLRGLDGYERLAAIKRGEVAPPLTMPAAGRRAGSTLVTAATVLVAGAAAAASGANRGKLAICTTAPKANAFSSLRCHPLNCGLGTLTAYPY